MHLVIDLISGLAWLTARAGMLAMGFYPVLKLLDEQLFTWRLWALYVKRIRKDKKLVAPRRLNLLKNEGLNTISRTMRPGA